MALFPDKDRRLAVSDEVANRCVSMVSVVEGLVSPIPNTHEIADDVTNDDVMQRSNERRSTEIEEDLDTSYKMEYLSSYIYI